MSNMTRWVLLSLPFTQVMEQREHRESDHRAEDTPLERRHNNQPPSTQIQLDLRHILATVVSAAIVGAVVMYGQQQTIKPRLEAMENKLEQCHGHIEMLRRDLYMPRHHHQLPQNVIDWIKQEWWI